jgi:hypothetical protein
MKTWWVPKVLKFVALAALSVCAFSVVVMLLWNAVIPDLFSGPGISFWQAAALLLLSHILLRGWSPWRHTNGWKHDRWHHRFEKRLASMTPEERERFREESHRRGGTEKDEVKDR